MLRFAHILCLVLAPALAASAFAPSARASAAPTAVWTVESSYSSRETVARGPTAGQLAITHFAAKFADRAAWGDSTSLTYGLTFSTHRLDAAAGLPLPKSLNELSLNLGAQRRLSARWSALISVRPGLYGDFERIDTHSVNAPLLLLANYAQQAELTWSIGMSANPFSDRAVIPIAGVRWAFAPGWRFNIGMPHSGVTWSPREALTWRAGVSFQGDSFRITNNLGSPAPGIARLANTLVEYREIRAGIGLSWKPSARATLGFELGVVTDRKIDFIDRDYRLDGGTGFFGAVSAQLAY